MTLCCVGLPDFLTAVYNASTLAALNKIKNNIFTMGSHFILIEWPKEVAKLLLNLLDLKESKMKSSSTPSGGKRSQSRTPGGGKRAQSPGGGKRSLSQTPDAKRSRSPSKTPREKRYWTEDEEEVLREGIKKVSMHIYTYIYACVHIIILMFLFPQHGFGSWTAIYNDSEFKIFKKNGLTTKDLKSKGRYINK